MNNKINFNRPMTRNKMSLERHLGSLQEVTVSDFFSETNPESPF